MESKYCTLASLLSCSFLKMLDLALIHTIHLKAVFIIVCHQANSNLSTFEAIKGEDFLESEIVDD